MFRNSTLCGDLSLFIIRDWLGYDKLLKMVLYENIFISLFYSYTMPSNKKIKWTVKQQEKFVCLSFFLFDRTVEVNMNNNYFHNYHFFILMHFSNTNYYTLNNAVIIFSNISNACKCINEALKRETIYLNLEGFAAFSPNHLNVS